MKYRMRITCFLCLLCLTSLVLSACSGIADSWQVVRLTGESKTVMVPLEYDGAGIGLSVNLNFTDGGANTITVLPLTDGEEPYAVMTYPADFDDWGLSAVVNDGVLTVDTEKERQFSTDAFSITVYASVTSYELVGSYTLTADAGGKENPALILHITGGAAVQMTDIAAEAVSVCVAGAADVVLSGDCGKLDAEINGACVLEADTLTVQHGAVTVNGVGAAEVSCTESLDVKINGAGTVQYRGTPVLTKTINGLGTVSEIPDDAT